MLIWPFPDGMHARVQDRGESSEPFPSQMGLSRDVSWPPLFSVAGFLRCCLMHLMARKMESTFDTAQRLQVKTKVKTDIVNEFLFADDCALNATTKAIMQNSVDKFSKAWDNFGQTIRAKNNNNNRSDAPANAWKNIRRAQHHQGTTTEGGKKVHLPRQHPL